MPVTPGQILSHYRIVAQIGAGGMGVVYRAEDTRLRRHIALKVLPAEVMGNAERRSRFLREARTAAAITHPNITTIHEIDEAEGTVFIAMELVEGESLRDAIHGRPLEIKVALRLAIEMAEGLAEAHKAHIIHRDLKPDNVIVTTAGHAKLLDFGLAKLLHERGDETDAEASKLSTVTVEATLEGRMLGTPAYMSPEQIRGEAVDARTDGFSFGAMLYEMVTGRLPFEGSTLGGILAAVLGTEPAPVTERNPAVPAELERIIRKCLQKDREARYQDTRDLLVDLRELQEGRSSLQVSRPGVVARAKVEAGGRSRARLLAWALAALMSVTGVGWGVYEWRSGRGRTMSGEPLQEMRMSSVTGGQDIRDAVLSPDARHLAILREGAPSSGAGATWGITMRQMATGSEVQVLPPQSDRIIDLSFSGDGERLLYTQSDSTGANVVLLEIPTLGGMPRKVLVDLDAAVGASPDGRRLAFIRERPKRGDSLLATLDVGSGTEREIATVGQPDKLVGLRPAWSPDGLRILGAVLNPKGGGRSRLIAFDLANARERQLGEEWADANIDSISWLRHDAVAVSARDVTRGFMNQIWRVTWPGGERRRITNDLSDYRRVSGSADGMTLAALRVSRTSNLWSVGATGDRAPVQLTFGSAGADVIEGISPASDGEIVFTAGDEAGLALWTIGADGASRGKISAEAHLVALNAITIQGRSAVAFSALGADLVPHIWRMDLDGGNAVQLTHGTGEMLRASSPDGKSLVYFPSELPDEIWGMPMDGGEPKKIAESSVIRYPRASLVHFSPDGTLLMFMDMIEGTTTMVHYVVPASGGAPIAAFERPLNSLVTRWHPDGRGLTYIQDQSTMIVWPLSGGAATRLFSIETGTIDWYYWSPDGRRVVFRARDARGSNLWLWSADGSHPPRPLTNFPTGEVGEFAWSPDGKTVYFTQGISNRDVVVLRQLSQS